METDLKLERLKVDKRWEDFVFCVITCFLKHLTCDAHNSNTRNLME